MLLPNFFAGVRKTLNSELWHACAGPLVSLPQVGSLVFYFPQGHSEQVNEMSESLGSLFKVLPFLALLCYLLDH